MFRFLRYFALLLLIVLMVVVQVVMTRYFPKLSSLDLPLIAVLYLTIARESLFWTVLSGSAVGFVQDALSPSPLGMNGFTKISIGCLAYMANSIFAIDRVATRLALIFVSSILAALLFSALRILFLNRSELILGQRILWSGAVNACVGLPLFYLFDKILDSSNE
jgi:rod shape-determining protein MreD